jgi:hypothetical protein
MNTSIQDAANLGPDAYIAWALGPGGSAPDGDRTPQIRDALARWCGNRVV